MMFLRATTMRPARFSISVGAALIVSASGLFMLGDRPPLRMVAWAARGALEAPTSATAVQAQKHPVPVRAAFARLERVPVIRTGVGWVEPLTTVKVRARIEGEIVERLVQD